MATFRKLVSKAGASLALAFAPLFAGAGTADSAPAIPFAEDYFPQLQKLLHNAASEAPGLHVNRLKVAESQSDLEVARAQRRPTARLQGRLLGSYETRDDIGDSFTGDVDANLTVAQPLYHWGQLENRQHIADHRLGMQQHWQANDWQKHLLQLRKAFLDWILFHRREAILRQSVDMAEKMVDAYRQLLPSGQSSEGDLLEMEARLLETDESLAFVQQRRLSAQRQIIRLSGTEPDWQAMAESRLEVIEPLADDAMQQLLDKARARFSANPDKGTEPLLLRKEMERRNLAILDRDNWPKFDLVAGIFSDQLNSVNQSDSVFRLRYFAGLRVNWTLFDGYQTRARKQGALARLRSAEWEQEAAVEQNHDQLENLLAQLTLHQKQIEARSKRLALLQKRLDLLRQQAESGRVAGTERMEREIDLMELRQRVMNARVDYLYTFMRLGLLLGEQRIPPPWQKPSQP